MKVAKESPSWANIVPVQYFIVSLLRGVQTASIKACQTETLLLSLFRYQRISLLPGVTHALPALSLKWTYLLHTLLLLLFSSLPALSLLASSPPLPNKGLVGRNRSTKPRRRFQCGNKEELSGSPGSWLEDVRPRTKEEMISWPLKVFNLLTIRAMPNASAGLRRVTGPRRARAQNREESDGEAGLHLCNKGGGK